MKLLMLVLVLLYVIQSIQGIAFTPVPIQYITSHAINAKPKEKNTFTLRTCGGCQFDKHIATVYINLHDRKWNPLISDFLNVTVLDMYQHFVKVNKDSSNSWVDTFSFTYSKTYLDLRLIVTNGNSPDLKYTLYVTFTKPTHALPTPNCQPRYISNEEEMVSWKYFNYEMQRNGVKAGGNYDLLTVFKTTGEKQVPSAAIIGLQLGYCFNPDAFPGHIEISVISTDEISAFDTYVCPASVQCNTTEDAPYYDTTSASVNFVTAHLKAKEDAGPVDVIVRGDGLYEMVNKFTLAASTYKKDSS